MALMKVENLLPGMVLADDVRDLNSRLLFAKGLKIEAQHLRVMKTWGIFDVEVEAADDTPARAASVEKEMTAACSKELSARFKLLDITHPALQEILKLGIHHRLKNTGSSAPQTHSPVETRPTPGIPKDILAGLDRIEIKLPEVPSLVFELNEIIADPLSSSGHIAQVVNRSPSLTAMLLKIVNSAFSGFRSKIDSITRAVTMIGSKEVSNLALGITIMETFKDIPAQTLDVPTFMEHSLAVGIAARLLAAQCNVAQSEQLFISGMLHDIGRLVLCKHFPAAAKGAFAEAAHGGRPLLKTELSLLGCSHMQLAKKLLNKWKLPYNLENNIYYHHAPSGSPQPELAAVIQVADIVVHALGIGNSGESVLPAFDAQAWDRLRISPAIFRTVTQQTVHQMEAFRVMLGKG
jgi:HD-like signal output (HDOD) protein